MSALLPRSDSETALRCWVCGAEDAAPYKARSIDRALVPGDLAITDSRYGTTLALHRCRRCSFIFAEGGDLAELLGLYEQLLSDPGYEGTRFADAPDDMAHRARVGPRRRKDAARHQRRCCRFPSSVRASRPDAQGVEPSRELVAAARRLHGVDLIQGTVPHEALAAARFDIVLLADVIEHVADPVALLRAAGALVAPGGVLMVVTPDVESVARRLLGKRWWHFRLAHVGYFDKRSLGEVPARARDCASSSGSAPCGSSA